MNIVHFDVDEHIDPYLTEEKYSQPLQDAPSSDWSGVEAVTIKSISIITSETIASFTSLKLIITRTVGFDHIDLAYCKEKGIAVYRIIDYGSYNIAEHAFALLLAGTRNIREADREIHEGIFSYKNHLGVALKGKTLGVVGTGHIGVELIRRAKAFEMNVVAYDISCFVDTQKIGYSYVPLDILFQISDIISLHAPLLPATKHMINDHSIKKMKDGVILINTARGGLIDTNALVTNIKKFRFVGLDVLEDEEEFDKNNPLLSYKNVLITPHSAFYSDDSVKTIALETQKLIESFTSGNSTGRVV